MHVSKFGTDNDAIICMHNVQGDVTCLIYVLGLRLLKDYKTMRGFLANDPFDALQLWINHKWPTCCGRNDSSIIYA